MDGEHASSVRETMIAPAVYLGVQQVEGGTVTLWNLTADIPGHPVGSTVSDLTLRALGYEVPEVKK